MGCFYSEGKWHETDVVFWLKNETKLTKQREMKCKKKKLFSFSFSNRNLKATKEQILFIYFFKNNDVQCIKDKTLIYMHIKQVYVLFIFLL